MGKAVAALTVGVIILAVLVVGSGGLGMRVTSHSTEPASAVASSTPLNPPLDGASGVVYDTYRTSSGLSLFGLDIVAPKYVASVGFVPPAGCEVPAAGEFRLEGACVSAPASGDVSGTGTTAGGTAFTIVSVPISKQCFEVLQTGDVWPSADASCAR
jgi:hypothetical protein